MFLKILPNSRSKCFLNVSYEKSCTATVTGQLVNLGNLLGQKVPCKLRLSGRRDYVNVLDATLKNLSPVKHEKF